MRITNILIFRSGERFVTTSTWQVVLSVLLYVPPYCLTNHDDPSVQLRSVFSHHPLLVTFMSFIYSYFTEDKIKPQKDFHTKTCHCLGCLVCVICHWLAWKNDWFFFVQTSATATWQCDALEQVHTYAFPHTAESSLCYSHLTCTRIIMSVHQTSLALFPDMIHYITVVLHYINKQTWTNSTSSRRAIRSASVCDKLRGFASETDSSSFPQQHHFRFYAH